MKCVICKTGETSAGLTTVTFQKNKSTIIFREVPCLTCDQCGEVYIEEETSKKLMEGLNKVPHDSGEINIRRYEAA